MASLRVHELINLACATGCLMLLPGCQPDQRDNLAANASNGADTLKKGWNELNANVENLDPDSSMRELETGRKKLAGELQKWTDKADMGYAHAKAELDRIDAAERLKELQKQLDGLQESGKKISDGAHQASQALTDLKEKIAEAQTAYDSAKEKAKQLLP